MCIHLSSPSIYIPLVLLRTLNVHSVPVLFLCPAVAGGTHTHTVAALSEGAVAGGTHGGKLPARDFYRDFYS